MPSRVLLDTPDAAGIMATTPRRGPGDGMPGWKDERIDSYRVGITGHRDLPDGEAAVAGGLGSLLARLQREHGDGLGALSAVATGADTLLAEAAIALGIPLEVVIPFRDYADDFPPGLARERFERLLTQARHVHHLPAVERSNDAYLAAGRWVVDHSDLLVAVWDGDKARGRGGTGDVVQYARSIGRPAVVIDPSTGAATDMRPATSRTMDTLDEYKFVAESTQFLTERRQGANQTYLTLNVGIFAVFGAIAQGTKITSPSLLLAAAPLFLAGIMICIVWLRTLADYKALIGWRYQQLIAMEGSPTYGGNHRLYTTEWEKFFQPRQAAGHLNFTRLEGWVPRVLIALYIVMACVLLLLWTGVIPPSWLLEQ